MESLTLRNDSLLLEFDGGYGRLVRFVCRETGWEILDRPHLGLSFRLLLPLPARRNNPVHGEKQRVDAVERDGRSVRFLWNSVTSEHGGAHGVRLGATVRLERRRAVFSIDIENRSDCTIENVYFPYLGDIRRPKGAEYFKTFLCSMISAQEWSLWPVYQNLRGYFGVDFPTQLACGAPTSPFILLRGPAQGLYAGVLSHDSQLVAWHTELRPGPVSTMDETAPEGLQIGGKEVSIRFAAVHVPYLLPGERRSLPPVALECYQGGWRDGVDIYRNWRSGWMKRPPVPSWAKEPHSWQQIHMNSPEDELRYSFKDLLRIGEDCARHGVKALQVVGWNDGGQDQGNPSHSPDPRLGTFDELRDVISRIKAMGVKVILFAKFTWADLATARFRNELFRMAVRDPHGDFYLHQGWQYQTVTQLLDINTKRLVPMCFLSREYLEICNGEFRKMVELGADGILFDECMFHGNALFCFDTSHGHPYGAMVYANDLKLIENFAAIAGSRSASSAPPTPSSIPPAAPSETSPAVPPSEREFLFGGEGCYDWELEAYHLSYSRSRGKGHIPLMRYMQPDLPMVTAVYGFDDRQMVNQCLLYRYIISYEPYHFKGRLDDFPLTLEYGKLMDRLRTELRDYFWDGEFRQERGVRVTSGGKPHTPYSVFLNRKNGKLGVAVANYDERKHVTVHVEREDGSGAGRYRLVDDPVWRPADAGIILPPRSAAVVIE